MLDKTSRSCPEVTSWQWLAALPVFRAVSHWNGTNYAALTMSCSLTTSQVVVNSPRFKYTQTISLTLRRFRENNDNIGTLARAAGLSLTSAPETSPNQSPLWMGGADLLVQPEQRNEMAVSEGYSGSYRI